MTHYCAHIILAHLLTSSVHEGCLFVFHISVLGSDLGTRVRPKMGLMGTSAHLVMGAKEGSSSCCDNSKHLGRAVLMFLTEYQKKLYQCGADWEPQSREPANATYNVSIDRALWNEETVLLNCL